MPVLGQQIDKLLAIDQTNPSKAVFLGDATQTNIGDTAACGCLKGLYPPLHAGVCSAFVSKPPSFPRRSAGISPTLASTVARSGSRYPRQARV